MKKQEPLSSVAPLPHVRELSSSHREHLRTSGLSDQTLVLAGIYTERAPARMAELLGKSPALCRKLGTAIVFPFLAPGQEKPLLCRLRPDRPRQGPRSRSGKRKLVKYEQPAGTGTLPYFPPRSRTEGRYQDRSAAVLWTEGEKKTLLLDQLGYAVVGAVGVSCFHDASHRQEHDAYRLHALLREHVLLAGRDHRIVFDADATSNDSVMIAARRLAGMLLAEGAASVRLVQIPPSDDEPKRGIDDFFVRHGEEATRELLERSGLVELEPLPIDDPHVRVRTLRPLRDAPVAKHLRMPPGYECDRLGGIFQLGEGEGAAPKRVTHGPLLLGRVVIDVHSGEERLEVLFRRHGAWQKVLVDRVALASRARIVEDLAPRGAPITSGNAAEVVQWIAELEHVNERQLPRTQCSTRCGWHEAEGQRLFVIGEGEAVSARAEADSPDEDERVATELLYDARHGRGTIVSGLGARGKLETQLEALRAAWAADPIAAVTICGALAAPLLKPIGASGFAVHLVGDSSRGKSSMLKIAASVYGNPNSEAWVPSWNSTGVGLEVRAHALCDLPLCIDEAGVVEAQQRERAVYMLIGGTGRVRGSRGGGLRDTLNWRTVVLSTGEQDLTTTSAPTGAQARVLQFRVRRFGELDGAGVDALRTVTEENYGHVGRAWLELLARIEDWSPYQQAWREGTQRGREKVAPGGVQGRQAAYLALLALTESMAHDVLGLGERNGETIHRVLLGHGGTEQRQVQVAAERAIDLVRDVYASRLESFAKLEKSASGANVARTTGIREVLGYIDEGSSVLFVREQLDGILGSRFCTEDVLRDWLDRGWIQGNKGRLTTRKRINGVQPRLIAFEWSAIADATTLGGPPEFAEA